MCCFSMTPVGLLGRLLGLGRAPLEVKGTRIFARHLGREQLLAYDLDLSVSRDVAMILPLPVAPGSGEAGLEFVDLSGYPEFFDDLGRWGFSEEMQGLPKSRSLMPSRQPRLVVHQVGSFEASYVPGLADMRRLDPRFRVPDDAWAGLPAVHDFGFAVFKLRRGRNQRIHPMALRFRTRDPGRLFFPTVHVHDGQAHPTAAFHHTLLFQGAEGPEVSDGPAGAYVRPERCAGLVDPAARVSRMRLHGERPNEDTWVSLGAGPAR